MKTQIAKTKNKQTENPPTQPPNHPTSQPTYQPTKSKYYRNNNKCFKDECSFLVLEYTWITPVHQTKYHLSKRSSEFEFKSHPDQNWKATLWQMLIQQGLTILKVNCQCTDWRYCKAICQKYLDLFGEKQANKQTPYVGHGSRNVHYNIIICLQNETGLSQH